MKLRITQEWLRKRIEEGPEEPPCGIFACSPKLYEEMLKSLDEGSRDQPRSDLTPLQERS